MTEFFVRALVLMGLLWPAVAIAQQASGLAGVARDTSGSVLPGVTVEAASPVLIEKIRQAVTDGEGRYNLVDLRPGTYVVTFTLPGFATVRREGIVLTAGFTAPVSVEMSVGSVAETVTVTGASPLVDTQNARQQKVVTKDMFDTLPTSSMTFSSLTALAPGVSGNVNVGGSIGILNGTVVTQTAVHGKVGGKHFFDGMRLQAASGTSNTGYIPNPAAMQEWTIETGGGSAESPASAVMTNMVPKEGGNTFRGSVSGFFTNDSLQSNNLTEEIRARGLDTINKILNIHGVDATLGGPLRRDRLWFFTAFRQQGSNKLTGGVYFNSTQGSGIYTPDISRPATWNEFFYDYSLRLSFQASPRNRLNVFVNYQDLCACYYFGPSFIAPEAISLLRYKPQGLYMATWSSPITNKLLLEAGAAYLPANYPERRRPETGPNDISTIDQAVGFRYNAALAYNDPAHSVRNTQRFALSYITGAHIFKTGITVDEALFDIRTELNGDVDYVLNQGVPVTVNQWATPYLRKDRLKADFAFYAQDQWTVKRLTINGGLRFEYFNGYVPAQTLPATRFVPARNFDRVDCTPCWTDLSPRLGVSYDLFGTGLTALKVTVGRYTGNHTTDTASRRNPVLTSVNTASRAWIADNGNYVPDCDLTNFAANGECGPISNQNFGKSNPNATTFDDDTQRGFGRRDYFWDIATELQQQIGARVSLTGGYYRNWYGNFIVTDNELVTPSDFDTYCITAPVDARLPGGGGYPICGLYDVSPAKFGQNRSRVTYASNFGKQKQVSDFFNVSINTRFRANAQLGGGIDTGRTVTDSCFVVDSPQALLNCRVVTPFSAQTQVKLFGSYTLPADVVVSGIFQNVSGPQILANYAAPNDQIAVSLGRNLAACGARPVCTSSATVPLIRPQTMFEDARTQLDLRLSKIFSLGSRVRVRPSVDVFNVLNASSVLASNQAYGPAWLRPVGAPNLGGAILTGRLIEIGGQLTF